MTDKRKRNRLKQQPLQAVDIPDALLMIQTLQDLSGFGKTKIFEEIASGKTRRAML